MDKYRFVLCPIPGEGFHCLKQVVLYDDQEVIVGRNALTFTSGSLDDDVAYVSRNHLSLRACGSKVFLMPIAHAHRVVAVNGQERDNLVRKFGDTKKYQKFIS